LTVLPRFKEKDIVAGMEIRKTVERGVVIIG
jgi:hypothetical protein